MTGTYMSKIQWKATLTGLSSRGEALVQEYARLRADHLRSIETQQREKAIFEKAKSQYELVRHKKQAALPQGGDEADSDPQSVKAEAKRQAKRVTCAGNELRKARESRDEAIKARRRLQYRLREAGRQVDKLVTELRSWLKTIKTGITDTSPEEFRAEGRYKTSADFAKEVGADHRRFFQYASTYLGRLLLRLTSAVEDVERKGPMPVDRADRYPHRPAEEIVGLPTEEDVIVPGGRKGRDVPLKRTIETLADELLTPYVSRRRRPVGDISFGQREEAGGPPAHPAKPLTDSH